MKTDSDTQYRNSAYPNSMLTVSDGVQLRQCRTSHSSYIYKDKTTLLGKYISK